MLPYLAERLEELLELWPCGAAPSPSTSLEERDKKKFKIGKKYTKWSDLILFQLRSTGQIVINAGPDVQ